ncbi:MAG: hypothetical protein ACAI35_23835 [Candidatus Methylacidiphilales bacterium]|nr:hypothetical protein [Candidatus Methylacidiphilales bacterium]
MKYYRSNVEVRLGDRATYSTNPVQVIGLPSAATEARAANPDAEDDDEYPSGVMIVFNQRNAKGDGAVLDIGYTELDMANMQFVERAELSAEMLQWLKDRFNINVYSEPSP